MRNDVTDEQIVKEMVAIFGDEQRKREYHNPGGATHVGICGWCGVMSPINRVAFIADFGQERTENAERAAVKILAAKQREFEATKCAAHEKEADENAKVHNFVPSNGSFVWALQTGMKNEGDGLPGTIDDFVRFQDDKELKVKEPCLVCVEKVFSVDSSKLEDRAFPDDLVKEFSDRGEHFPGGARNEDDDYEDLKEQYRTWYICAAAAFDEKGRWFLIDAEGYSYARYILLPVGWETMFPELKAASEEAKAKREQEAAEEKRLKEEAEQKDYEERCKRWEHLMTDIRPLKAAAEEAHNKHGWNSKEKKDANRKMQAAQRDNIAAMINDVFPGLKLSIRHNNEWGAEWHVSYEDGPTEEEFNQATDLDLFAHASDEFDGMTDYAYVSHRKHVGFADKYMCCLHGDVEVGRNQSDANRETMVKAIEELVPDAHDGMLHEFTDDEIRAIAEKLEGDYHKLRHSVDYFRWKVTSHDISSWIFRDKSFYTKPEPKPQSPAKPQPQQVQEGSFKVMEYNERCIVVVGDTKPLSNELKKYGIFNSRLSCGAGWLFSKRKKDNLRAADKLLGGAITEQMPEILEGGE